MYVGSVLKSYTFTVVKCDRVNAKTVAGIFDEISCL
jgi:hypothetical protein